MILVRYAKVLDLSFLPGITHIVWLYLEAIFKSKNLLLGFKEWSNSMGLVKMKNLVRDL
jgi:hypothetical protein